MSISCKVCFSKVETENEYHLKLMQNSVVVFHENTVLDTKKTYQMLIASVNWWQDCIEEVWIFRHTIYFEIVKLLRISFIITSFCLVRPMSPSNIPRKILGDPIDLVVWLWSKFFLTSFFLLLRYQLNSFHPVISYISNFFKRY